MEDSLMLDEITDDKSEFLHVIITSSQDRCSEAALSDLIDLNLVMKKTARNYREVCMNYNAKDNKELEH